MISQLAIHCAHHHDDVLVCEGGAMISIQWAIVQEALDGSLHLGELTQGKVAASIARKNLNAALPHERKA